MTTKILHEATDLADTSHCTRIVELSATYSEQCIKQTTARLASYAAQVIHLNERGKPRSFILSPIEADAFVVAWTQYRADLAEAEAAARLANEQALREAYAIADEIPVILIHDDFVEIAAPLHWHCDHDASGADLLDTVQAARKTWAGYIRTLQHAASKGFLAWTEGAQKDAVLFIEQYAYLVPFAGEDEIDDHPF